MAGKGGIATVMDNSKTDQKTLIEHIEEKQRDGDTSIENVNTLPRTVNAGTTKIYKRGNENVYIDHNIEYTDAKYDDLSQIPKMIIYTEGNVYISCSVTRVDAIIIAGKTVRTCANSSGAVPDKNSTERSKQLVINGMIIANKLELDRSYGTSTGYETKEPAEIINYDSSAILWSNGVVDTSKSNTLTTAYQQELPARY